MLPPAPRPSPPLLRRVLTAALVLAGVACGGGSDGASESAPRGGAAGAAGTFTVAVAASLAPAVEALAERSAAAGAPRARLAVGASSTLVRQLELGAPYEVLVSADERWLDRLADASLVDPASRVTLGRGRLVVAARGEAAQGEATDGTLPGGRWACGDPAHVPLGRYARAALAGRGQWDEAAARLVPAADARAALRLVERGEVDWGILYRSDVDRSEAVHVRCELDAALHPEIRYVAAAVPGASEAARGFLRALAGAEGAAVLADHGLDPPRQREAEGPAGEPAGGPVERPLAGRDGEGAER